VQWFLVTFNGNVTVPATTYPAVATGTAVDLSLVGDGVLLAWKDGQALVAAEVSNAGVLTDGPVLIAPQATGFAVGHLTVAYARPIDHASRGITRVFTRPVELHETVRRRAVR
jgi:hypothetical protein